MPPSGLCSISHSSYTSLQLPGNLLHPHTRMYRTHRRIQNQTLSFLLATLQLFPNISSSPSHFSCSLPGTDHAQPELGGSTLPIVLYLLFLQSLHISLPEEVAGPTSREFSSLEQPNICTTSPPPPYQF